MKKLLLLDADVVIDLHSLGLFQKFAKAYELRLTRKVLKEARFYPRGNKRIPIDIGKLVTIIDDISIESLQKVLRESKDASLSFLLILRS